MSPDYIPPEIGLPLAAALVVAFFVPEYARWARARRRNNNRRTK